MLPYMQPLLQTTRTQVRSNSHHLIVLGGVLRQQLSVSNQLRAYHEGKKEWMKLREMEQPRYQHGIAVIGNFLFVVGGQVKENGVLEFASIRFDLEQLRHERKNGSRHGLPVLPAEQQLARDGEFKRKTHLFSPERDRTPPLRRRRAQLGRRTRHSRKISSKREPGQNFVSTIFISKFLNNVITL